MQLQNERLTRSQVLVGDQGRGRECLPVAQITSENILRFAISLCGVR